MQVFVAFNISEPTLVREKVKKHYNSDFYEDDNCFFLATDGETTRQVATKIGLGDEEPTTLGVVIPITTYWGLYKQEVWEWINVKLNANGK